MSLASSQGRVSVTEESTSAALSVILDRRLDTGGGVVEIYVASSDAATFAVSASIDGTNWRFVKTITLAAAGSHHEGALNAYPMIRVSTTDANDNLIEIVSGSL